MQERERQKIKLVAAKSTWEIAHLLIISNQDSDDLLQDVSVPRSPGGITRHDQHEGSLQTSDYGGKGCAGRQVIRVASHPPPMTEST